MRWRSRADGTRLFVAEADANAVAVFDLAPSTSGIAAARGDDRLAGRIPAGWYPTALLARGDTLLVATRQGARHARQPGRTRTRSRRATGGSRRGATPRSSQLDGTLMTLPVAALATAGARRTDGARGARERLDGAALRAARLSAVRARHLHREGEPHLRPGVRRPAAGRRRHVARALRPRRHAQPSRARRAVRHLRSLLRERRGERRRPQLVDGGVHDRLPAEDGAVELLEPRARATTTRGRIAAAIPDDDAAEPARGYLWNLAQQKGITFRNYGEFVVPGDADPDDELPAGYRGQQAVPRGAHEPALPGLRPGDSRPAAGRRVDRRARGVRAPRDDAGAGDRAAAERPHRGRARRLRRRRARWWRTTTWRWAA